MTVRISEDELTAQVGDRIRRLRKERGLTMQDVVDGGYVGATSHLSHLERGHLKPTLTTLARLAECLDVQVQDLLPARLVDRADLLRRVKALSNEELAALDAMLRLIGRGGG